MRPPHALNHPVRAYRRGNSRCPIDWKLITDLPVTTEAEAIEKPHWYAFAEETPRMTGAEVIAEAKAKGFEFPDG